jgi:hypothetical protein
METIADKAIAEAEAKLVELARESSNPSPPPASPSPAPVVQLPSQPMEVMVEASGVKAAVRYAADSDDGGKNVDEASVTGLKAMLLARRRRRSSAGATSAIPMGDMAAPRAAETAAGLIPTGVGVGLGLASVGLEAGNVATVGYNGPIDPARPHLFNLQPGQGELLLNYALLPGLTRVGCVDADPGQDIVRARSTSPCDIWICLLPFWKNICCCLAMASVCPELFVAHPAVQPKSPTSPLSTHPSACFLASRPYARSRSELIRAHSADANTVASSFWAVPAVFLFHCCSGCRYLPLEMVLKLSTAYWNASSRRLRTEVNRARW